jgi:hypothetical protein
MNNYPEQIEQTAINIANLAREINAIRSDMREIEIEQMGEVLSATDSATMKPLFSNDKQRDYALAVRLGDDGQYCALKVSLAERELEKGIAAAKLERLRAEFKLHLLDRQADIAARLDIRLTV